jgi:hypothetical protein
MMEIALGSHNGDWISHVIRAIRESVPFDSISVISPLDSNYWQLPVSPIETQAGWWRDLHIDTADPNSQRALEQPAFPVVQRYAVSRHPNQTSAPSPRDAFERCTIQ